MPAQRGPKKDAREAHEVEEERLAPGEERDERVRVEAAHLRRGAQRGAAGVEAVEGEVDGRGAAVVVVVVVVACMRVVGGWGPASSGVGSLRCVCTQRRGRMEADEANGTAHGSIF